MAYLHENIEEFTNAVNLASEQYSILPVVAEKDYYVTARSVFLGTVLFDTLGSLATRMIRGVSKGKSV